MGQAKTVTPVPLQRLMRALLAGFLSLLLPGSGSFYLGRISTATSALALITLGSLGAALLWKVGLLPAGALVFAVGFISLAAHLGSALLAARESLRLGIKRGLLVSIAFMLAAALLMMVMQEFSRRFVMATYAVATISMEPSLEHGDRVLVRPSIWRGAQTVQRGQIVAVHDDKENQDFVRRLIATEGDSVHIKGAELWINDKLLSDGPCPKPWAQLDGCFMEKSLDGLRYPVLDRMQTGNMDLHFRVPEGKFFVLRDRRDMHLPMDSVPKDWLRGVVSDVWWSYIGEAPQLHRLGLHVAPESVQP